MLELALAEHHISALLSDSICFEEACTRLYEMTVPSMGPLARRIKSLISRLWARYQRGQLEPEVMEQLPTWQRDIEDLLQELREWMQTTDRLLSRANVSIAGEGWSREGEIGATELGPGDSRQRFNRPQARDVRSRLLGILGAGRVGGQEPVVAQPQELATRALSTIQSILNVLGGRGTLLSPAKLQHSPAARQAVHYDDLSRNLMWELQQIVSKANEAVAASRTLSRLSGAPREEFDAAVDAIITPMDEATEALEVTLNEMINLLFELSREIPATATAAGERHYGIFGDRGEYLSRIGQEAETLAQEERPR